MIERTLRFTDEDMVLFAAASGDRSPLHTDPEWARRTSFGECIVYGGLLSLGMLGLLPAEAQARIRSLQSLFNGPVLPGAVSSARAQTRPDRPGEWEVRLTGRGRMLARLLAATQAPPRLDRAAALVASTPLGVQGPAGSPDAGYRPGRTQLRELVRRFGIERVDTRVVEGLLWASSVVGMGIPAFDGLCAAVTIGAGDGVASDASPERQRIVIREHDQRSDRLVIDGVLTDAAGVARCLGLIECFPFAPTPLPESAALAPADPLPPVRGTAVVVGGSRGLGAALALELLVHGHVVHVIYAKSSAAAAELSRLAGPYAARVVLHNADAGDGAAISALAATIEEPVDVLVLCAATPPLPMGLSADSAGELSEFVAHDVALVAVPVACFLPLLARDRGSVLFCSAAAVTQPSGDLPQLAAAKAAVEGFASWVAAAAPAARIVVARPPRMRTDLANTPSARRAAVPPTAVAALLVQRLLGEETQAGLSIVELDPAEAFAP